MNSFEFKNIFNKLKEEKKLNKEKAGDKKFIKYSDIIEEKLISNKRSEPILRDFKQLEEERKDWFKVRNDNLNKQNEENLILNSKSIITQKEENNSDNNINNKNIENNNVNNVI